jgi:hypothetical protein
VIDTIFRDDPAKEQILRPMFGDEWAAQLTGSVSRGCAATGSEDARKAARGDRLRACS